MSRYRVQIPPIPYPLEGMPSVYCPPDAGDFASFSWGRWGSGGVYDARHLFVDDWRLEHLWRKPGEGLGKAILQGVVTAPDFTIDNHFPYPLALYQAWRSRILARYWQSEGVIVVPVLMWGASHTWEVCASSIEPGSVVAVRGPQKTTETAWLTGMLYMIEKIKPSLILHFGRKAEYPANVLYYPLRRALQVP